MLDSTLEAHPTAIYIVNATVDHKTEAGKTVKQEVRFLVVDINEVS
jgi:hypothetical protein